MKSQEIVAETDQLSQRTDLPVDTWINGDFPFLYANFILDVLCRQYLR